MPIDPSIIGTFRPPQFESPVNAMAQMYQLRALQNESEKNQLAMEKTRREMDREQTVNRLMSAAGGNQADFLRGLERSNLGSLVPEYKKKYAEADESTYKAGQEKFKYATEFMKNTRANLNKIKTAEDAKLWSAYHHEDGIIGPMLRAQGITLEKSFADIDNAWATGTQNEWLQKAAEGTEQYATRLQMGAVQDEFDKIKSDQPGATLKNGVVQVTANPVQDMQLMAKIAQDKGYSDLAKLYMDQSNSLSITQDRPLTPNIKEYEYSKKNPEFAAYQRSMNESKGTNVHVDTQGNSEKAARGRLLVADYEEIVKTARESRSLMKTLQTMEHVLDQGFKTGFGTNTAKAAAGFLAALNVPEAERYASNAQVFLSAARKAILQQQLQQKGTQTENDRRIIEESGARLGNTVEANKFIIDVAKAQARQNIKEREFYDKWWDKKKTYDGAADAWINGEGSKSLFDQPELTKYKKAEPVTGASRTPTTSSTRANVAPEENPNRPLTAEEMKEFNELQKRRQTRNQQSR